MNALSIVTTATLYTGAILAFRHGQHGVSLALMMLGTLFQAAMAASDTPNPDDVQQRTTIAAGRLSPPGR